MINKMPSVAKIAGGIFHSTNIRLYRSKKSLDKDIKKLYNCMTDRSTAKT